jgi:hypothetical protein
VPDRKVILSEWASAGAFVLATFGISLALYRLVADFREGTIAIGLSGWHYAYGILPWALILLSAAAVAARRIPSVPATLRRGLPLAALALAALALAFAIVAFAEKPGEQEFGRAVIEHVDRDEIAEIAARAFEWTPTGSGIRYGFGLLLLAAAALLSLVASAAHLAGSAGRRGLTEAARVAERDGGSVSPPIAASGTRGDWQVPPARPSLSEMPMAQRPAATAEESAVPGAAESNATRTEPEGSAMEPSKGQGTVPLVGTGAVSVVAAACCMRCGAPHRSPIERFCARCGAPRWSD